MVRIPRHVEVVLGSDPTLEVKSWYDFDFFELLVGELEPIFEQVGSEAQNEVSAEAPADVEQLTAGGLRWWLSLHVRRWPVATGQSSAQLGRSFLSASELGRDEFSFSSQRPSGPALYYMEEIEHTGRGSLLPTFILDERVRQKLGERLRAQPDLISRTLNRV